MNDYDKSQFTVYQLLDMKLLHSGNLQNLATQNFSKSMNSQTKPLRKYYIGVSLYKSQSFYNTRGVGNNINFPRFDMLSFNFAEKDINWKICHGIMTTPQNE